MTGVLIRRTTLDTKTETRGEPSEGAARGSYLEAKERPWEKPILPAP